MRSRQGIPLSVQQVIAVLIPSVAALVALLVVYPSWRAYLATRERIDEERGRYNSLSASLSLPHDPFRPAEEGTEAEPSQFLGYMSALVRESGCQLVGLDAQAEGPRDANVRSLRSRLSVRGAYAAVRGLVSRIRRADRLLTIRDIAVRSEGAEPRSYPLVLADLTVERYVSVPPGAAPAAGAGAPPAVAASTP